MTFSSAILLLAEEIKNYIYSASEGSGQAKVIDTQFNSDTRMALCRLQGIDYSQGSIFSAIEPFVLPEVFALVGERLGQNELYQILIAVI